MSNARSGDDQKETDWAEIFTTLLSHTSMGDCYTIAEHTIPQLNAILDRLPKHLEIKMGITGMFSGGGSVKPEPSPTGKAPKLSEIVNFCNGFSGGK